jgi:uncharacterized protein YceH (UPF0502 family)
MLRGPQTPGELKQRSERLHRFADLAAAHESLERLVARELVVRHPRRPGQKEDRYEQVLGGVPVGGDAPPPPEVVRHEQEFPAGEGTPGEPSSEDRLDRLERELAALRAELESLREALGEGG